MTYTIYHIIIAFATGLLCDFVTFYSMQRLLIKANTLIAQMKLRNINNFLRPHPLEDMVILEAKEVITYLLKSGMVHETEKHGTKPASCRACMAEQWVRMEL